MMIFDRVGLEAGGGGKMVGWGPGSGIPVMGMGFQTLKNLNFFYRWRGPLVMIFDRVGLGAGGGARWWGGGPGVGFQT